MSAHGCAATEALGPLLRLILVDMEAATYRDLAADGPVGNEEGEVWAAIVAEAEQARAVLASPCCVSAADQEQVKEALEEARNALLISACDQGDYGACSVECVEGCVRNAALERLAALALLNMTDALTGEGGVNESSPARRSTDVASADTASTGTRSWSKPSSASTSPPAVNASADLEQVKEALGRAQGYAVDCSEGRLDATLALPGMAMEVAAALVLLGSHEEWKGWRCECGDLNRWHESSCYRCGAGRPADA